MFEGTLIESRGLAATETQKWTALGSLTVQCAVVAMLLAIPMLRPDVLPMISVAPQLSTPLLSKPPMVRPEAKAAAGSGAMGVEQAPVAAATRPLMFPHPAMVGGPVPAFDTNLRMTGVGPGPLIGLSTASGGNRPAVVRARVAGPVQVSRGVSEGMLLAPIQPVYPPIAKAAGVQGTVVLEAVISKAGRIESLHAVSGPEMLRKAALDAVEAARYTPYKLNGEAVDVQTTITVVFELRS